MRRLSLFALMRYKIATFTSNGTRVSHIYNTDDCQLLCNSVHLDSNSAHNLTALIMTANAKANIYRVTCKNCKEIVADALFPKLYEQNKPSDAVQGSHA